MVYCINSSPLSDEALGFALDDVADIATLQHLAQCTYCAHRLEEMRLLDTRLMLRLRRIDCPSPQLLTDYYVEMLDDEQKSTIAYHVQDCSQCQSELTQLEDFLNLPVIEVEVVPANVIPLRRPIWVLRVAPVSIEGNLALKGLIDGDGETQHDVTSGSARIFLESQAIPSGFRLTGQVIDTQIDWTGAIAQLSSHDQVLLITVLDEACEFNFDVLDTSPVTLNITAKKGVMIIIEDLKFQE